MKFLIRVTRRVIEVSEMEIEATDEDSAWEIAEEAARESGVWHCEDPSDSDYEVTDVSEN